MRLYISQKGNAMAPSRTMEALLRKTVRLCLLQMKASPHSEVGLALTDNPGIQRYNKDFRNIDEPTDVLSFPMREYGVPEPSTAMRAPAPIQSAIGDYLGDIMISTERAAEQAAAYGHGIEREMAFLTVHGMLHLLGLDHETDADRRRMEKLQRQILRAMGLPRDVQE